jgi:hypothetical protein
VIARWEGTLDVAKARMVLNGQRIDESDGDDQPPEPRFAAAGRGGLAEPDGRKAVAGL